MLAWKDTNTDTDTDTIVQCTMATMYNGRYILYNNVLNRTVTTPGYTHAFHQQTSSAPFDGTLQKNTYTSLYGLDIHTQGEIAQDGFNRSS